MNEIIQNIIGCLLCLCAVCGLAFGAYHMVASGEYLIGIIVFVIIVMAILMALFLWK